MSKKDEFESVKALQSALKDVVSNISKMDPSETQVAVTVVNAEVSVRILGELIRLRLMIEKKSK